jgi:hypothetical protein
MIRFIDSTVRLERRSPATRPATIELLIKQLFVVQRLGRWLSLETHGDAYIQFRELNELLHQANRQVRDIQNGTNEAGKRFVPDEAVQALLR